MSAYPLLQKPLYAYQLPQQLLDILSVRSAVAPIAEPDQPEEKPTEPSTAPHVPAGALSCQACGNVVFQDVEEQRRHFRSDWHRFNVAGKRGVTEEEFEAMDGGFHEDFQDVLLIPSGRPLVPLWIRIIRLGRSNQHGRLIHRRPRHSPTPSANPARQHGSQRLGRDRFRPRSRRARIPSSCRASYGHRLVSSEGCGSRGEETRSG